MTSPLAGLDEHLTRRSAVLDELTGRVDVLADRVQALIERPPVEPPPVDPDPIDPGPLEPEPEQPQPGAQPAWLARAAPMTWGTIPDTAPTSIMVDPLKINTSRSLGWCGMAWQHAGSRGWLLTGGHGDGSSNAPYMIPLADDEPRWQMMRAPTEAEHIVKDQSHYLDGRPSARHTYWDTQFDQQDELLLSVGAAAVYGTGGKHFGTVDAFDPDLGDWVPAGTYPPVPAQGVGLPCVMTEGGDIYKMDLMSRLYRLRRASDTWEPLGQQSGVIGIDTPMVHDPKRNRLVRFSATILVMDIVAGGVRPRQVQKNGPDAAVIKRKSTACYSWTRDSYIFVPSGSSTLYEVDPETWEVTKLAIEGQAPGVGTAGLYSRIAELPELGALVIVARPTADISFVKLSPRSK